MSTAAIVSVISPPPRRSSLHHVQRTPSLTNSESTTPDGSEEIAEPPFPAIAHSTEHARLPSISEKCKGIAQPIPIIPQAHAHSHRRPRPRRRRDGILAVLADARLVDTLLHFLLWEDARALCYASHETWHVLSKPRIKDVLLARFVPGYRVALRSRDRRYYENVVRMDLHDLDLLMSSLETPLHQYPMHALSVLSSETLAPEQDAVTKHLQLLAQAHSRVVLLLQSMVHSSSLPVTSDIEDTRLKLTNSSQSALRELTFPAPLAYFGPDAAKGKKVPNASSSTKRSRSAQRPDTTSSAPSSFRTRRHKSEHDASSLMDTTNTDAKSRRLSTSSKSRRMSIFGREPLKPPPLPSSEPPSMRFYSGSWRRNVHSVSDDEDIFKPPKRRFVTGSYSSESSLTSSSGVGSNVGNTPAATQSTSALPRTLSSTMPIEPSTSPHGLFIATSRRRAPVLRVFVPCSALSEDAIAACEDQIVEHGLWEHLSIGDVVCNFGYVPPIEHERDENRPGSGSNTHNSSSLSSSMNSVPSSQQGHSEQEARLWLVYNGDKLVIYRPTDPAPIPDALTLPSPFYYAHILPAHVNPRFRLVLPSMQAKYTLARLSTTVSSPHSFNGLARVKTYQWLANATCGHGPVGIPSLSQKMPLQQSNNPQTLAMSVSFNGGTPRGAAGNGTSLTGASSAQSNSFKTGMAPGVGVSVGWQGEWVLQGEGTKEGKRTLQEMLRGASVAEGGGRVWEIVKERCGGGRLWMRLLPQSNQASLLEERQHSSSNVQIVTVPLPPQSPPLSINSHDSSSSRPRPLPLTPPMKEFGVGASGLPATLPNRVIGSNILHGLPQGQVYYGLGHSQMHAQNLTWTGR